MRFFKQGDFMKYCVGYQPEDEFGERFAEKLIDYKDRLSEVYFSWSDMPSGRSNMSDEVGFVHWEMQDILLSDLILLKNSGIGLNLLFNGNCYGSEAVSLALKNRVISVINYIKYAVGGIDSITTTSPFIASVVKNVYKDIRVRASVNMRITDVCSMQYLSEYFDEFYIQRDFNRDFEHIARMKKWADENGKKLSVLANSGCMKYCSGQIFHDNLVAHENENVRLKGDCDFPGNICHNFYKKPENRHKIISNTWIRPEDIHLYEDYVCAVKLATRMTSRPMSVIKAYIDQSYRGNTLDLLEPNHTAQLGGCYISNKKFPSDFAERMSKCKDDCGRCGYCREVFERVCVMTAGEQL